MKSEASRARTISTMAIKNRSCSVRASASRIAWMIWSKRDANCGGNFAFAEATAAGLRSALGLLPLRPAGSLKPGGNETFASWSWIAIDQVIAAGTVAPVVDQVQLSPFEYRRKLLAGAESRAVAVEAYSPLGTGRHLTNGTVKRLASRLGRTPAQVLVGWSLQKGLIVIPKPTHRDRIEQNSRVFDFTLSDEDMAELDALDETEGTERALEEKWW